MGWFTGTVLYVLIWWTVLFAVLPFGVRTTGEPDALTGWRGAPAQPMIGRKVLATTLVASAIWAGAHWLITSDYMSFRSGMFALPGD